MDPRIIKLKSVRNLRTLGGLRNAEGKTVREGILLRSAALAQVTESDAALLRERYHLEKIIDLRTFDEKEKAPEAEIPGVSYLHLPVCPVQIPGVSREMEPGKNIRQDMLPDLRDMYRDMVTGEEFIKNFSRILKTIIQHRGGAVLWHCTAGKDRCGLVTVFLLFMLGVDLPTITQDYLLTNLDSKKTANKYYWLILLFRRDKKTATIVREAYAAKEAYLQAALDAIDERFGGLESYFQNQLKIDEEEIRAFREYALSD